MLLVFIRVLVSYTCIGKWIYSKWSALVSKGHCKSLTRLYVSKSKTYLMDKIIHVMKNTFFERLHSIEVIIFHKRCIYMYIFTFRRYRMSSQTLRHILTSRYTQGSATCYPRNWFPFIWYNTHIFSTNIKHIWRNMSCLHMRKCYIYKMW